MRKVPWINVTRKGGLAKEIRNLPFAITMFGDVKVLVVDPKEGQPKPVPKRKEPERMYGPYSNM